MTPDVAQRSAALGGLGAALFGGVVGWIAAFSGLGVWGLLIGLAVTVIALLALARGADTGRSFAALAVFWFAFILLTWPLLWLIVGYVRYAITGDSSAIEVRASGAVDRFRNDRRPEVRALLLVARCGALR